MQYHTFTGRCLIAGFAVWRRCPRLGAEAAAALAEAPSKKEMYTGWFRISRDQSGWKTGIVKPPSLFQAVGQPKWRLAAHAPVRSVVSGLQGTELPVRERCLAAGQLGSIEPRRLRFNLTIG
jgi:hypothetical protein